MGGQDGVVWFNNSGGDLWCWVDGEFQLGFLSVIDGETFHKEGGESGSGTSTEGVEDKETLKTGTLIGKLSDSVKDKIDDFFTDGVVTTGVVVGGILFASTSFAEEGVEGVISTSDGLVTWHLTVRLDAMLKAVQFPASVTDLDT